MTKSRPERPDFLDEPSDRVRARQAQIDRLAIKLERTYRQWLTCGSMEMREALEAKVLEYEDRIAHLERLNRMAREHL
jgi:ferredoxin-NADP reductase